MTRDIDYKGYTIQSRPYKLANPPWIFNANGYIKSPGLSVQHDLPSMHQTEDEADEAFIKYARTHIDNSLP